MNNDYWSYRARLAPNMRFRTWSIAGRAKALLFAIEKISETGFVVRTEDIPSRSTVSWRDFEYVCSIFDDYTAGQIPRHTIRDKTRVSSYILGILGELSGRNRQSAA